MRSTTRPMAAEAGWAPDAAVQWGGLAGRARHPARRGRAVVAGLVRVQPARPRARRRGRRTACDRRGASQRPSREVGRRAAGAGGDPAPARPGPPRTARPGPIPVAGGVRPLFGGDGRAVDRRPAPAEPIGRGQPLQQHPVQAGRHGSALQPVPGGPRPTGPAARAGASTPCGRASPGATASGRRRAASATPARARRSRRRGRPSATATPRAAATSSPPTRDPVTAPRRRRRRLVRGIRARRHGRSPRTPSRPSGAERTTRAISAARHRAFAMATASRSRRRESPGPARRPDRPASRRTPCRRGRPRDMGSRTHGTGDRRRHRTRGVVAHDRRAHDVAPVRPAAAGRLLRRGVHCPPSARPDVERAGQGARDVARKPAADRDAGQPGGARRDGYGATAISGSGGSSSGGWLDAWRAPRLSALRAR